MTSVTVKSHVTKTVTSRLGRMQIAKIAPLSCGDYALLQRWSKGFHAAMRIWTADETVTLISQWPTASAAQIASTLHRSRASVLRKAHRLCADGVLSPHVEKHYTVKPVWGRPGRGNTSRYDTGRFQVHMMMAKPPPPPIDDRLDMRPCALLELDRTRCHWPLGERDERAALFCGGVAVRGGCYCMHHSRMAQR